MPRFRTGKPRLRLDLTADYPSANGVQQVVFNQLTHAEGEIRWLGDSTVACDLAGLYLITGGYILANTASALGRTTQMRRAGFVSVAALVNSNKVSGTTVSTVVEVNAGETVVLEVTGDGSADILAGPGFTTMTVTRIGPVRWT